MSLRRPSLGGGVPARWLAVNGGRGRFIDHCGVHGGKKPMARRRVGQWHQSSRTLVRRSKNGADSRDICRPVPRRDFSFVFSRRGFAVHLAKLTPVNNIRRNQRVRRVGRTFAIGDAWTRFKKREVKCDEARGKGLARRYFMDRSHLPLRGKLGWMTPRVGVKTTLTMKRGHRGSRSQAGAPLFLPRAVHSLLPRVGCSEFPQSCTFAPRLAPAS